MLLNLPNEIIDYFKKKIYAESCQLKNNICNAWLIQLTSVSCIFGVNSPTTPKKQKHTDDIKLGMEGGEESRAPGFS